MKKLLVPRKGVKVRDPKTGQHFPEEGSVRMMTSYYTRRVNDGDLEVRDVPAEEKKSRAKAQDRAEDSSREPLSLSTPKAEDKKRSGKSSGQTDGVK